MNVAECPRGTVSFTREHNVGGGLRRATGFFPNSTSVGPRTRTICVVNSGFICRPQYHCRLLGNKTSQQQDAALVDIRVVRKCGLYKQTHDPKHPDRRELWSGSIAAHTK